MSTNSPKEFEISAEDMRQFTRLVELGESQRQMDRIEARLKWTSFLEIHSKEKCDAMFARLTGKDQK